MCALPTQPTLDSLTVEGLKKAGYPNATAGDTLQLRAEDWVDEVKQDIYYANPNWKPLMVTSYCVTAKGVSRYALPADYGSDLSITILDGTHTGTLQAGAAGTATLAAAENMDTAFAQGKLLLITSGTAIGACSQCSNWNNTTKVATVTPNFSSTPSTENYMLVDHHYSLLQEKIERRDEEPYPHTLAIPTHYFPIGQGNADDDETGEFELFPTPDDLYGVQLRYAINLLLVDLTANVMKTLYRKWRHIFVQGVVYKCLQNDRDERYVDEFKIYRQLLNEMKTREVHGQTLSHLQSRICE